MSNEPDTTDSELDPAPYIRTFAKDYASLSGKAPENTDKKSKKEKPPKKQKKSKGKRKTADFNITDEQDPSLLVTVQPDVAPTNLDEIGLAAETIDQRLKQSQEDFSSTPIPNEAFSLPRIADGDIVSQASAKKTPQESDRAGILARLKAHAVEEGDLGASLGSITPIANVAPEEDAAPSPLHTYTSDFQDHIEEEHASSFSVLAAEKDAAPIKRAPKKRVPNNVLPIAAGIILVLAGAGAVYGAYLYMSKNAPVVSIAAQPSLISPDSRVMLSGKGSGLLSALAEQANQPLGANQVELTYVNVSTTTAQGVVEEPASGGAFITELNLQAPDILLRNIDPSSMVGIVSAGGEIRPFFILRVTSYERTFAGMLQWEPTMFSQLSLLYPLYPAPAPAPVVTQQISTTSTTSASSTSSKVVKIVPAPIIPTPKIESNQADQSFTDETVDSHDVRALKDNQGHTLVLYGYVDKQTLIIARNEAAFTLLLNKLQSSSN
jgi:hypothetical protein